MQRLYANNATRATIWHSNVSVIICFLLENQVQIRATCQRLSEQDHDNLQRFQLPPVNQTVIKEKWLISARSRCYRRGYQPFHQAKLYGWAWANALQYDSHYTPQTAGWAPKLFLVPLQVQGFPTRSDSPLSVCASLSNSIFYPPLLILSFPWGWLRVERL